MKDRILIKLSGEALMGESGFGIDVSTINFIAKEIKKISNLNYEICLIIGGGNIFRGVKGASEGIDRSTSDYMGMLAIEGSYDRMHALMATGIHPADAILHFASQEGDTPKCTELMEAGANPNVEGLNGKTAIDVAGENNAEKKQAVLAILQK